MGGLPAGAYIRLRATVATLIPTSNKRFVDKTGGVPNESPVTNHYLSPFLCLFLRTLYG